VTVGPEDRHYFNFTDYYQNALRLTVASTNVAFTLTPWLDLVGEVRVENTDRVRMSAAYARVRPRAGGGLTLVAGRVPPVFGLFANTRYGSDNPLVSRPLAYQYLSTLRYDALPPSIESLLVVRGEGWRVSYPAGTAAPGDGYAKPAAPPAPGVPVVSTSRWDTGVLTTFAGGWGEVTGGATVGSLSDPRVDDNNGSWQVVGRVRWQPHPAWAFGASAARGAFVADAAARDVGASDRAWPQSAVAVDASFAAGHLGIRGEVVRSGWRVPLETDPTTGQRLSARGATLEVRYRLHPRLDIAARLDRLDFSEVAGSSHSVYPTPWDAGVTRVETALGYRLARQWRVKVAYQHNWRFGDEREGKGFPVAQLAVWF
jgi:hypothetical protein